MSTVAGALSARTDSGEARVATTEDVQTAVRDAAARGIALRLSGAGTWQSAGRPVAAQTTLNVRGLAGIVEYVPGDLTITAWAGTTLAELDEAVAAHGQWLALDPFGSRGGTLGATVATASSGPLAASFGTPRDVLLGVQCVTGDGEVVHGGARVVKHVAGFDLVRLMTGAWGTLGVLTRLTFRLRACAPVDATYAVALGTSPVAGWFAAYRSASVSALAAELLSAATATALGLDAATTALVRVSGNDEAVTAQERALRELGTVRATPGDIWRRLAERDPRAPAATLRLSARPARIGEVWEAATRIALGLPDAIAHATLDRGIVRVVLPHATDDDVAARLAPLEGLGCARVFEILPATLWPRLAAGEPADSLSGRIRSAFDPERRLNPGIMGEA